MDIITPVLINSAIDWVAQNHQNIPELANRSAEFLSDVITQGGIANTIRRVGNAIVWSRRDGPNHMIGMLDQIDNRMGDIEDPERGLQSGFVGLTKLSMVTLGFSSISTFLLGAQFEYLE
jgi:hypothetical protein